MIDKAKFFFLLLSIIHECPHNRLIDKLKPKENSTQTSGDSSAKVFRLDIKIFLLKAKLKHVL